MNALDLFRGAGGWSVACQRLGIEDDGVEYMKEANLTAGEAGHKLAFENVWEPAAWLPFVTYDGLIASPPCQTFSAAGKGKGREALDLVLAAIEAGTWRNMEELRTFGESVDERTALVLSPLHYALVVQPEWIAMEQVPTVLPVWQAIAPVLEGMGYSTWTGNLQAEQYGVPQTRKRAILMASRTREVTMPEPTHSKYYSRTPERLDEGVKPWVSMAEALTGLHRENVVPQSNYSVGGDVDTRGERTLDEPASTVTSKSMRWLQVNARENATIRSIDEPAPTLTTGHSAAEMRWLPGWCHKRPSTTIVGSFKPEVVAAPGYRTTVSRQNAPDSVRVTVQEAGALQSFPADYPWQGSKTKQYLQVGNAIPPLLAEAVLRAVS